MKNNLLSIVIAVTLGIILTATLMVPVITDASHSGATSHTNGTNYLSEANGTVEMILSNQNSIVSNGDIITGYDYPAVASDGVWIAMTQGGMNIFWVEEGSGKWSAMKGANVEIDAASKTVSVTNITHASTNDNITGDSLSLSYNDVCYYRSLKGPMTSVARADISSIRVLEDSPIHAVDFASSTLYFFNGEKVTANGVLSETSATITLTPSTPEEFNTLGLEYNSSTPNMLIVPAEIWSSGTINDGSMALLYAIPVITLAGMLLLVARPILTRYD